ncbi:ankyrin [Wilcoxina mikolae CBS 423.85]|nr:ankyrin [Wilcoxina mikolae CBS 423.85]
MQAFILLLSRGANHIAAIPQLGTHLLHTAVASQNLLAAEHLLHLDPLPDAADPIDLDDRTPLHLAAFLGDVDMAKLLLSQGADADVADYHHASPLLMARCPVVAQLLIKAGATVDTYDRYGMDTWQRWIRNPGKKVQEMWAVYGKETMRAKHWRDDLLTVLRAIIEPDQDVEVTVPMGVWPYVEDDGQERWKLVKCMVASLSAARMANFLAWLRKEKLPGWMAAREKVLEAAEEVGLVWQKQPGDKTSTHSGEA